MDATRFGLKVTLPVTFDEAVERTTAALKTQGFGVLTTIDVRETLKQKLDVDFRRYTILGACNPPLAHKALSADLEVGLLLPCNVVVYESDPGTTTVMGIAPGEMLRGFGDLPALADVAREADERLRAALATLETPA